jgi:uncharacterized sulfatase
LRREAQPDPEVIFGQYDLHNSGLAYMRMVRTKKHKYVRHFKANLMDELYDLENDPGEERNLLRGAGRDGREEIMAPLRARLSAWQQSIGDPVLKSSY